MQYNNIMVGIMRAFDFFTTHLPLLTYYYSITTTHFTHYTLHIF